MDLGLLRPGTVPISPDTVLWFEFLLNPSLLQNHLAKPLADPSATDLIIKFITINSEQKEYDVKILDSENSQPDISKKWTRKNLALKILSLKVAAYLKWDLNILEKKLPVPIQVTLLQDLFYVTTDSIIEIPTIPEYSLNELSDQLLFTLVLYHRWRLRATISRVMKALTNNKQPKELFYQTKSINGNSGAAEAGFIPSSVTDEFIRKLELYTPNSVTFLNNVLEMSNLKPKVPSFDTFKMLTEDSVEVKQDWENMYTITEDEFKCQIHYDLAVSHLLREEYQNAKKHISKARELFLKLGNPETLLYCRIQKEYLDGYCLACELPVEGVEMSLTHQLLNSIKDQYTNIIQILQADNIAQEIPQVYRDNLELDIQGGLLNRKIVVARDLLLQIQCLNLVRKVVGNDPLLGDYVSEIRTAGTKGLDVLFWAFDHVLENATETNKQRIAQHFLYLVLTGNIDGLPDRILNDPKYTSLFNEKELKEIKKEATVEDIEIPALLLNNDWGIPTVKFIQHARIEIFELEQKLIQSYDAAEIRETLIELHGKNGITPLWRIDSNWELPIPLQSIVTSLPRGFLQDFAYILLAKSKELAFTRDFIGSKALLSALEVQAQNSPEMKLTPQATNLVTKLLKLVSWETLLVEIWHCLFYWPATKSCDTKAVTESCKQCLAVSTAALKGDSIIPRQEIIEYCTVFLLNMAEWDCLGSLEKQWSCFEFASAMCNVAKHIVNGRVGRKFPREAWDLILTAFGSNRDQPQKRNSSNSSGSGGSSARDSFIAITSTFGRLREITTLTIVISLLARLHNILRDEATLDLYAEYLSLWPATVPNANSYNVRMIGEQLHQVLTQALKYYPNWVPWLRLMGDLNFVLGYNESAMKYYLEAIIVATELFTMPARGQIDDLVYRRMIKCCGNLQCFTQAVVLCQFLEEVDYSLAFKMASSDQKNAVPADAMDAYYHCIWDTTILEYLINLHTKRGEHHRKQLAIKVIGCMELNSNNNEEIQREAANSRKAKFLRALAKQYVYG